MSFDRTNDPGPALSRGMWAAVAIAAVILALRVFAKIKLRQFRFDDVLMIVAWVSAILRNSRLWNYADFFSP
jgi:hypothetical protein